MDCRRRLVLMVTLGGIAVLALAMMSTASGASPKAHAAAASARRATPATDPANPLDTAGFTGTDPLSGAHLFVESPWQYGGDAADAIANEVGLGYLSTEEGGTPIPWAQFEARVEQDAPVPRGLLPGPRAREDRQLSAGAPVQPVHRRRLRTGDLHPGAELPVPDAADRSGRGCGDDHVLRQARRRLQLGGSNPNFDAEVNAFKDAVGNFPALIFVEEDAIDTICWRSPAAVSEREALLKYEIDQLSQLPHALLYVEGGTSDANSPAEAARVLNASDAYKIRGFFTNDTHFNWAYKEIKYGEQGLGADRRPALRRRHPRRRQRPAAEPAPGHAGDRAAVQPARSRARAEAGREQRPVLRPVLPAP